MLGSGGIFAKFSLLIAGKVTNKVIDLSFNERKKACRYLTKLYYAIDSLCESMDYFYYNYENFSSDGSAFAMVNALNNSMGHFENASNYFIDLSYDLNAGLSVIDPALAATCELIYASKISFMNQISNSVYWDHDTNPRRIIIEVVNDDIFNFDLEEQYSNCQHAIQNEQKIYWPVNSIDELDNITRDVIISFETTEEAETLKSTIDIHYQLIKEAREQLRKILSEKFSIEELLFQSKVDFA